MKKYLSLSFFIGLICLFLLSSIIYITPVYGMSTSLNFVGKIALTSAMSTSESIKNLVTTGKAKNGIFEGIDIIKILEDAGV